MLVPTDLLHRCFSFRWGECYTKLWIRGLATHMQPCNNAALLHDDAQDLTASSSYLYVAALTNRNLAIASSCAAPLSRPRLLGLGAF